MSGHPARARGLALVLVAGILALLAAFGAAWTRMAVSLRATAGASLDRAQARLLARSGIEYAFARVWENPHPASSATQDTQPDDWTFRDGKAPLEKALNVSYGQTEPYRDIYPSAGGPGVSSGDGKYDPGLDTYADLNENGRFDSWSGRLRGAGGPGGATFALKISGQGGEGGINVNSGYLGAGDDNKNNIPDYRDLGERGGTRKLRISPPVAPPSTVAGLLPRTADTPALTWDGMGLNRRTAFILNQLGLLVGAATPRPGDRIIQNRPAGGYREVEELAGLFPPTDWVLLRPHLTTRSRLNRCAVEPNSQKPDGQYLLNPDAATPEAIAALWCGMGEYRSNRSGAMVDDNDFTAQNEYAGDVITALEARRLAAFIQGRPFVNWYELFTALVENSGTLFVPAPDARMAPSMVMEFGSGGSSIDPSQYNPDHFGDRRSGSRIAMNKALLAHAMALPTDLSIDFSRYDMFLTGYGRLDGNDYRGYIPVAECMDWVSYETVHRKNCWECTNEEVSAWGPAMALGAGPAAIKTVESLGRLAGGRARVEAMANARATWVEGRIIAQSQGDFENDRVKGFRFEAGRLNGRPILDRAVSYPCFSLDGIQHGGEEWGEWSCYPPSCGEVRLMDWCWVDPAAIFYLPNWDIHQPERPSSLPKMMTKYDAMREVAKGANWLPDNGTDLWRGTPAHDSRVPYECWWGNGSPKPGYENSGPFPLFKEGSGSDGDPTPTFREGTIEGWYQEDSYFVLGIWFYAQDRTGGSARRWVQPGTTDWSNPIPPVSGNRYHVAYVFDSDDSGDGRFTAYVDGIWRGTGDFTPVTWDGDFGLHIHADEFRIRADPVPKEQMIPRALRGRFWNSDSGVPSFTSGLYQFDGPAKLIGARWDGFVPKEIRDAAAEQAAGDPDAPKPLRVELLIFNGPADTAPVRRIPLSEDGRWVSFQGSLPQARYLRYQVWLDGIVQGQVKKTPVFERVEIGFQARQDRSMREW